MSSRLLFSANLLSVLALTTFLVACGGGGGGGTPAAGGNLATNQAVLGPLSGTDIRAYQLTDLAIAIEGPITANSSVTDLASAGSFALALTGIADDEWILVTASNGQDIDADDDGVVDPIPTLNNGTVHAVAKASAWRGGDLRITALSDMAWRLAKDQAGDSAALTTRLNQIATWLIATDIDGVGGINYDDLLQFNPRQSSTQSAVNYASLLPSGDSGNPSYIDRLYSGDSESDIDTAIVTEFSATPWVSDTTPDVFSFTAETAVNLSTETESNTITVAGINRPSAISVTGGDYSINGGTYTSAAGTVSNGDTVKVRLTSSASNSTATAATLTIGGVSGSFDVTTLPPSDTTPDAFAFTDQTDVALSTQTESNAITVAGINTTSAISVTGGDYSINGGTYTSAAGTVSNADTVKVRLTSSASNSTATAATLTIGGVSDSFDVTTLTPPDTTPDAFAFTDQTDVALSTLTTSNSITVFGLDTTTSISISGGEYSTDETFYTSTASEVRNTDMVWVRLTSSAEYATTKTVTLTIGGVSASFNVTTVAFTSDAFLASLNISMVPIIAAGESFDMGCSTGGSNNVDPDCRPEEQPEHSVTFPSNFAMSAFEITWDAWDACVADGGACTAAIDDGYGKGSRPVTNVSYNDITGEFIPWLNSKTGNTYRLPTEAEWEYAARAGSNTAYSWGDLIGSNNANCYIECSDSFSSQTAPVGSYSANSYGLFDMHGNVWEWTADIYNSDYIGVPVDGSARSSGSGGTDRVRRGGSFLSNPPNLRSAARVRSTPSLRHYSFGFRLVQDL